MRFQHTAARRRLGPVHRVFLTSRCSFNTQPPEGGWPKRFNLLVSEDKFQHTATRRRLVIHCLSFSRHRRVSTHSRPKAAGYFHFFRFLFLLVSTHSRPKAAGFEPYRHIAGDFVSTHSRPKAAGCRQLAHQDKCRVSTHSRPKAAGFFVRYLGFISLIVSTHSRPKAAGWIIGGYQSNPKFQHTAARRRLACDCVLFEFLNLFQHTAARRRLDFPSIYLYISV